jgi:signal peptidase II
MLRLLWISLVVLLLDQGSKLWIEATFEEFEVVVVWPVFNLTLVHNTGAAFSLLADAGGWQRVFFIGVAVVVTLVMLVWLARLPRDERLTGWGLALVIGGALGNLVDRVRLGKVIDFLQWHWEGWYWPTFNLADSAITLGVALLLIDGLFLAGRRERAARR